MDDYLICVLQEGAKPSIITTSAHASDRIAINSARKIAHGRQFEVWRGNDCITGLAHLIPRLDE